jgi:hypothetical protein
VWCLPYGHFPLIPKDEGHGVMISAFVSREFGFGMTLSQDQLDLVNGTRVGQAYIDEESAIKKGSKFKDPLAESAFICYLQYGANLEGYWSYEDMIIQFEDFMDCLKCLYPQYDFYFMFDH